MSKTHPWTVADARTWIRRPASDDNKYSRGVTGLYTGSDDYPGAAALGVGAALRTGVGMVRYVGPRRCQDLILAHYPEALVHDGDADVWVIGSGMPNLDPNASDDVRVEWIQRIWTQNVPIILDAGALAFGHRIQAQELEQSDTTPQGATQQDATQQDARPHGAQTNSGNTQRRAPTILTPHAGELARLLECRTHEVSAAPLSAARRAAKTTGAFVLLKGHTTFVAAPDGTSLQTTARTTWLATAGTGDALAGILGAMLTVSRHRRQSTRSLLQLIASANILHSEAARYASTMHKGQRRATDGPITVKDLIDALPFVVSAWLDAQ